MSKKINILIVDDHQIFLEGICALLESIPELNIVDTALNGKIVPQLISQHEIDIVVTDINMPEMDGIELSKLLKDKYPKIKTLILSTHNDSAMISKCIKNNVDGYLLKNAEKKELLKALKTIYDGEKYFAEEVKTEFMNQTFYQKKDRYNTIQLSRREKEVLKYITLEYTTQEISDKLFISQNTVNTHRKNLLSKLNSKNTAGLVKYAMENRLLDEED
ncbi:DNA-binding response regulator [Marivirga lumbricoides]|uniref:DNA-binding response regulator n=1 Tax=Marivirga lumbricoides TaxID=1046115 RepID=A0ABQ1MTQ6_9BACT|nr:DNA-binding response regulator [Marivirga lumbricoides]